MMIAPRPLAATAAAGSVDLTTLASRMPELATDAAGHGVIHCVVCMRQAQEMPAQFDKLPGGDQGPQPPLHGRVLGFGCLEAAQNLARGRRQAAGLAQLRQEWIVQ